MKWESPQLEVPQRAAATWHLESTGGDNNAFCDSVIVMVYYYKRQKNDTIMKLNNKQRILPNKKLGLRVNGPGVQTGVFFHLML